MYGSVELIRAAGSAVCLGHDPRDVDPGLTHCPVNKGCTPQPHAHAVGPERFLSCAMGEAEQCIGR